MEYNKTKRGLEKGAAIFSTIMFSLMILTMIGLIAYLCTIQVVIDSWYDPYTGDLVNDKEMLIETAIGLRYLLLLVLEIVFSVAGLIFSIDLIKSPVKPDGTIRNTQGTRIALLVFAIISGDLITAGLIIAVLCLKDFKETIPNSFVGNAEVPQPAVVKETLDVNKVEKVETGTEQNVEAKKYNRTKRGLEKGMAIYSTIAFASQIVFVLCVLFCTLSRTYSVLLAQILVFFRIYSYGALAAFTIIGLGVSITGMVLSILLIRSPIRPDGTLKKRTGIRIALLVFGVLAMDLITIGLVIAVLCLKDSKTEQRAVQQYTNQINYSSPQMAPQMSVDRKIAEVKRLKELGVIDEETYKKAITKIINDAL